MISINNGGPKLKSLKVNDTAWPTAKGIVLPYDKLPTNARVDIEMTGGWPTKTPETLEVVDEQYPPGVTVKAEFPESMQKPYDELVAILKENLKTADRPFERALAEETYRAFMAYKDRASRDASGWYSDMTPEKRAAILKLYEDAALGLHKRAIK